MFCNSNVDKTVYFFSFVKVKAIKRSWNSLYVIMLVKKYGWAIQKSLLASTNQDYTFSHTCENSKMFNIT